MKVDLNIQKKLNKDEKEVLSIVKEVIQQYSPSTQAFIVGGWVRDKLLGTPSNDIDIMIDNMSGEDFAKLVTKHLNIKDPNVIRENPSSSKHITTSKAYIPLSSGNVQEIDFAQARQEIYREESRIPTLQPATPKEDAYRRDLTINSVFYNINTNEMIDYTGQGIKDLITMTIRTPQEPLKTFKDDPLRIFRTIRFAAKYNGKIDDETYKAMTDPSLRDDIKQKVSKERIGAELAKTFKNPNPAYAVTLLKDTGLWEDIITEALKGTKYEGEMAPLDMEQKNAHHKLTLWGHTLQALTNVLDKYQEADPEKRIVMILATLMHDLGKLYYGIHGESASHPGNVSYHGHEKESQEMVGHILKYLKMEPYIQQAAGLAQYHMRPHKFTEGEVDSSKAMRKFIRQMGEESLNWLDVFNMAMADAQAKDSEISPDITQQYQNLEAKLQEALLSLNPTKEETIQPILNGNEVMQLLNIKPGAWMSEIMEFVKELRDENPDITKEEATQFLRDKYQGRIEDGQIRSASSDKKKLSPFCPMHLFKNKKAEIDKTLENDPYEALVILKQLKRNYEDEKIDRLMASAMFKALLQGNKYRDTELLDYIFGKAEKNFFDSTLCSYVTGILLLIDTATDDDIITTVGNRVIKMSPGLMRNILDSLPKNIDRPKIKAHLEGKLK